MRRFTVKKLRHIIRDYINRNFSKTATNIILATNEFHQKRVPAWRHRSLFGTEAIIGHHEDPYYWYSQPEYEENLDQTIYALLDCHHLFVNARTTICSRGLPQLGIHKEAFLEVAKDSKRNFEQNLAKEVKTNPRAFYKYANSKLKTRTSVADLEINQGRATTNQMKAEELNRFFSSVFTKEDKDTVPQINRSEKVTNPMPDLLITEEMVKMKLKNLNPCKSQGPDEIHPRVLNELSDELAKPLAMVLQKSLDEGILPQIWKDAHITPIFKKGDRTKSTNYRPVSLTCVICKAA